MWSRSLAKAPKRYLLDSGVAAAAGGFTLDDVLRGPDLLGRVFDTFAAAQLRAEADLSDPQPRMHHLRDANERVEVDLVFDMGMGRAVGVEFTAANVVDRSDGKHLRALRDDLGSDFLAGAVLYSGSKLVDLDDRIYGVPLCSLWT